MQPIQIQNSETWNEIVNALPTAHILQTWQWGQVKSQYGWESLPYIWRAPTGEIQASALILRRTLTLGDFAARLRVLYIPKGPLLDWHNQALVVRVLDDLQKFSHQQSAIFIKIDPDVPLGCGVPGAEDAIPDENGLSNRDTLLSRGWRFSDEQIQFRNTILIDLTQDEEQLLAGMKQKTRYNVRLATKKGVTVRIGGLSDLSMLYEMYAKTAVRDGFVIRAPDYYYFLWETFIKDGLAEPLIAEFEGQPIAAVFIFLFAGVSRFLYGMSFEEYREKMPNHLLQWEAMHRSRELGCHTYDMWGAPDVFDESDSLWGVYRFKEGFNGKVLRTLGAWDFPTRPFFYRLYTSILPRILEIMRRRSKSETKKRIVT